MDFPVYSQTKACVILLGVVTSVFSKAFWPSVIKLLDVKVQNSLLDKVVWDCLTFFFFIIIIMIGEVLSNSHILSTPEQRVTRTEVYNVAMGLVDSLGWFCDVMTIE